MNEEDLRKIFEAHKAEVPDQGFSERVLRQLPERKSNFPQIVMAIFIIIGLVLMIVLRGVAPLLEQIKSLITSISHLQAPSPSSVISYLGFLSVVGIIGYAVVQADDGN